MALPRQGRPSPREHQEVTQIAAQQRLRAPTILQQHFGENNVYGRLETKEHQIAVVVFDSNAPCVRHIVLCTGSHRSLEMHWNIVADAGKSPYVGSVLALFNAAVRRVRDGEREVRSNDYVAVHRSPVSGLGPRDELLGLRPEPYPGSERSREEDERGANDRKRPACAPCTIGPSYVLKLLVGRDARLYRYRAVGLGNGAGLRRRCNSLSRQGRRSLPGRHRSNGL